jgi:7-cyano-7-deazaguanine synthase
MDSKPAHRIVVVLLSGGIDSTVAATLKAREATNIVYLLSIFYGQGAEDAEKKQSRVVADWLLSKFDNVVEHFEIEMRGASRASKTKLTRLGLSDLQLLNVSVSGFVGWRQPATGWPQAGYPSTRDETFALIAAAGAEARLRDLEFAIDAQVVLATNKDDIENFADIHKENYEHHLNAILDKKLMPQSGRQLRVNLPLIDFTKSQVVERGIEIGVPLHLTWSCYFGPPGFPCGQCDQCRWRSDAFRAAGIQDPATCETEFNQSRKRAS